MPASSRRVSFFLLSLKYFESDKMKFSEFKLNEKLAKAIEAKGYTEPSEIQEKTIPLILNGKDIIGQARTGTGKTAAFVIPIMQKINPENRGVQALVLVPTRELAQQVEKETKSLAIGQNIHAAAVFGGQKISIQKNLLHRGQHFIVATPGRLMDLMRRGWIQLSTVNTVILDEADKMFDMGFREDIEFILGGCPKERQTLLFSATMSSEIRSLTKKFLASDAEFINVSEDKLAVDEVDQFYISVNPKKRISTLADLISFENMDKCLVFTRTRRTTEWLSKQLYKRNIRAKAIHGGLSQNVRQRMLEGFRSGKVPVLITTDLLARGMDIQDISHIINFDFPKEKETYVHRIGRTARFGKRGEAITFCTSVMDLEEIKQIERMTNTQIREIVQVNE